MVGHAFKQAACKHVLNVYRPLVLRVWFWFWVWLGFEVTEFDCVSVSSIQVLRMRVLAFCSVSRCLRLTND